MKFCLRVLGSLACIGLGVFVWIAIGFMWWLCTFGIHRKLAHVAAVAGAAAVGAGLGMLALVGFYFTGELMGFLMGRS